MSLSVPNVTQCLPGNGFQEAILAQCAVVNGYEFKTLNAAQCLLGNGFQEAILAQCAVVNNEESNRVIKHLTKEQTVECLVASLVSTVAVAQVVLQLMMNARDKRAFVPGMALIFLALDARKDIIKHMCMSPQSP